MNGFLSRYAFRSTEKVALQEIGPRFTLKLRWLKKGIPAVFRYGEEPEPLVIDSHSAVAEESEDQTHQTSAEKPKKTVPPKQDEFIWAWKVCNPRASM
jgi:ribosome production factor 1